MKPYPLNSLPFAGFLEDLAREVEALVSDVETSGPDGGAAKGVTAYCQNLPDIGFDMNGAPLPQSLPFPYALVRVYNGVTDEQANIDWWQVEAEIQFGIRYDDARNQGHVPLLEMLQRVADRFAWNRLLASKYTALQDMQIVLQDSEADTLPYYFGSVIIKFYIPKVKKEGRFT